MGGGPEDEGLNRNGEGRECQGLSEGGNEALGAKATGIRGGLAGGL